MVTDDAEQAMVLAVASEPDADGRFGLTITLSGEPVRSLDSESAHAYVGELMYALACAEYDAAVLAQLTEVPGLHRALVGRTIRELRQRRRPILAAATAPLVLTPIVSASDRVPRMQVTCGDVGWQWEMSDVRQHVLHVLEVSVGVELDGLYLSDLQTDIGLDERRARGFVSLLREHRPDWEESADQPAG